MPLNFKSKADTLKSLRGHLKSATILEQFCFDVADWFKNKKDITQFSNVPIWVTKEKVIVRSSSIQEDSKENSYAGHFLSVPNVFGVKALNHAISKVLDSFGNEKSDHYHKNQIFIQSMLEDCSISGVAFTREVNTSAPYFVINYDYKSGKLDTVTDGSTNDLKIFYHARSSRLEKIESWQKSLITLLCELEFHFDYDKLDIEFAIKDEELYLLQVRPLILKKASTITQEDHKKSLDRVKKYFKNLSKPHPYLFGTKTLLGNMPDWNPAEIIGVKPKPLTISLYKELITDNIWAYQRDNYGYRNLRSFPLLHDIEGQGYIDVRVSLNSFVPASLDKKLAEKIVSYYLDELTKRPDLHDKVEFDIVFSCYTLDLPKRIRKLKSHNFSNSEISTLSESLKNLTNKIINPSEGLWKRDIEKISELEKKQKSILNSSLSKIEKIYWLIEDCKRYGTLPFAGLARAGFIGVQLLNSLVDSEVFSHETRSLFLASLSTISSEIASDFNKLKKDFFLKKYGHLRPGTYDICSFSYDEKPDDYFNWNETIKHENRKFSIGLKELNFLEKLLKSHGLNHSSLSFLNFIKRSIESRESSKFIFTKSLSEVLKLITSLGKDYGMNRESLAYADINLFLELYSMTSDIKEALQLSILRGREKYKRTENIVLPPLIVDAQDIDSFVLPSGVPNYITSKECVGEVKISIKEKKDLTDRIVFIPSADPGYDWLFSHKIRGLITMYGGVNSHMAIRANELQIPAIIGAGEVFYQKWSKSKKILMDCHNKKVHCLQ